MKHALLACLAALAFASPIRAHEVRHSVEGTTAIAVRLTYADGKPFAFEAYEVYPQGREIPAQVGRTDASGRALFVADGQTAWRIRAFSADGHGVDLRIETPPLAANPTSTAAADRPNRASLLLFGFSLLLAVFGGVQLFLRRRK